MQERRLRSGFTIVELLIVVVVIAILASITVVAYNGIQNQARASSLSQAIKTVDKAIRLKATDDTISTWWLDNTLTGTANPTIDSLISTTNLKNYLQTVPTVPGTSLSWRYDNDGETYNGCTLGAVGVNFIIYGANNVSGGTSVLQKVDEQIDDGNLACGKFRHSSTDGATGALYWSLSRTQDV